MGHICPECGGECRVDSFYTGRGIGEAKKRRDSSGWMGFHYWSCCYSCHLAYLILFDQERRFVGIVPNGGDEAFSERSGVMYRAGERGVDFDEISF